MRDEASEQLRKSSVKPHMDNHSYCILNEKVKKQKQKNPQMKNGAISYA